MSGDGGILDGVSMPRTVAAAVMCMLFGSFAVFLDDTVTPTLAAIYALFVAYFVAMAFDSVRAHPAYHLVSVAWMVVMFVLLSLGPGENSPFFLALATLTALGALVEAYNYRHGTSHLRIDW